MANGDITHADVEDWLKLGQPFPASSSTAMTEAEADGLCDQINAEVNLWLKRLAFSLPISDADSLNWLKTTKLFGAGALILDGMMAQADEENSKAERFWKMYQDRLTQLVDSGGDILQATRESDPRPNNVPVVVGEWDDEQRKRFLRFPQRAAADHYDNDVAISQTSAPWTGAIRGF